MADQGWVSGGHITQGFGVPQSFGGTHTGVDIGAKTGTSIISQVFGKVISVTTGQGNTTGQGKLSYGNMVEIAIPGWGKDARIITGHMQDVSVKPGDWVTPGTKLGTVGDSGFAYGSHLHLEARQDGKAIDPTRFLFGSVNSGPVAESSNPLDITGAVNNFTQTVSNLPGVILNDLKPTGISVGIGMVAIVLIIGGIFVIIAPAAKGVVETVKP